MRETERERERESERERAREREQERGRERGREREREREAPNPLLLGEPIRVPRMSPSCTRTAALPLGELYSDAFRATCSPKISGGPLLYEGQKRKQQYHKNRPVYSRMNHWPQTNAKLVLAKQGLKSTAHTSRRKGRETTAIIGTWICNGMIAQRGQFQLC